MNASDSIFLQVLYQYFKFSCFLQHLRLSAKIQLQNTENDFCFGMFVFEFTKEEWRICANVSNIE